MRQKFLAVAIAPLLAVGLAACGSDNATGNKPAEQPAAGGGKTDTPSGLTGQLAGAGASSQESAMKAWLAGFQSANPDAQVTYDSVGSGAGVNQFVTKQVAWAGTDKYIKGETMEKAKAACGSDVMNLPVYISPIVVAFNIDGVKELNLDAATIAKIFAGNIKKWNDPAIAAQNPDVKLPDLAVTPVHRSDKSGTTFNFTDYLHAAAPNDWTAGASEVWPVAGGESGDKTSGLVQAVQNGQGTIGYADASQVGQLGTVALKVGDNYVKFSAEAAAKAADAAKPAAGTSGNDLALDIDRATTADGAYPLILISYEAVCAKYDDAKKVELLKGLLHHIASAEGQKIAADNAGSAPISDTLREKIKTAIDSIQ